MLALLRLVIGYGWCLLLALGMVASAVSPATADLDFSVDDTGDEPDALAGNGVCATDGGVCTLRAAIEEALALGYDYTIGFDLPGDFPHTVALGSLLPKLEKRLDIVGPGAENLTVDLGGLETEDASTVFVIKSTVSIFGLTVTGAADTGIYIYGQTSVAAVRRLRRMRAPAVAGQVE
jgi:hypothetical protein